MSDYYSYNDPKRAEQQRGTVDYSTGSSSGWIWALIILVALVALIAIGATSRPADGTDVAPPAAPAPATEAAPQTIDQ